MNDEPSKQCTKCNKVLAAEEFYFKGGSRTSRRSACKTCTLAANHEWSDANRDRTRAQSRQWYLENKDRKDAANRDWYARNRQHRNAVSNEWYANHKETAFACTARRRANKRGAFVENVDRALVWARDEGICHICKRSADPEDWHLEHIIPLARGGEHSYANTAVSHPACNWSKGVRLTEELGRSMLEP